MTQVDFLRVSTSMVAACGIRLIGMGADFMFVRPSLLREGLRYIDASATQREALLPQMASWLRNVFTLLGGLMAGCGALVVFVSARVVPQRVQSTRVPTRVRLVALVAYATGRWIERICGTTAPPNTDALT